MRDLYSDFKLFNIAADLEINQYIDSHKLPEGGLLLSSFPELNLPTKAGTKEYYKLLEQAGEDGTSPSLDNLMDKMNGETEYDHSTWSDFDDLSEPDKKLIQKQVEHQLKDAAETTIKKQGNIPGEFKELIDRLFHVEPAKFDWKQYLRRFVGNSSIVYTRKLRRKYNKRYAENPGLKIKFKNHILVGIDTSGSVNTDELKEFYNELHHMSKTGHKITVAQCDTSLRSVKEFNPKQAWEINGRGGTSFQPVIDHFNEKKGSYTALIYLTDGEAYAPSDCPKNTLWVLSSISDMNEALPGKVIKLN
jgi:predicted metal-dependent peptidase